MRACGYEFDPVSCSTPYLSRSLRSLVRYRVEHSKIKLVSTRGHHCIKLLILNYIFVVRQKRVDDSYKFPIKVWGYDNIRASMLLEKACALSLLISRGE